MYLICSAAAAVVLLEMAGWLSLWIGLKIRSQTRAIVTALVVIFAWMVLPIIPGSDRDGPSLFAALFSPAALIILNEDGRLHLCFGMVMLLVWGNVARFFRAVCLNSVNRHLGRMGNF